MRKPMLYSAALHTAVIAVAYFGVPSLFRTPPPEAPPIAVELVMDQPPEKAKPKPKPPAPRPRPPRAEAPPEPPPPAPEIPPPPQTALAMPEAAPEPPPPPPKAKPKPKPKPKPKAKPKPKPKPKKVAAPRPQPRPKPPPRKRKAKPKPDQFKALLKNLAKQKARQTRERKQAALPKKPARPRPTPTPRRSSIEQRTLEEQLGVMVFKQIEYCWRILGGAKDAQKINVVIRIQLNHDGTVRGMPKILEEGRMKKDSTFQVIAESARRALLDPQCSPIKLPIEHYQIWKDITLNFDAGKALGQ